MELEKIGRNAHGLNKEISLSCRWSQSNAHKVRRLLYRTIIVALLHQTTCFSPVPYPSIREQSVNFQNFLKSETALAKIRSRRPSSVIPIYGIQSQHIVVGCFQSVRFLQGDILTTCAPQLEISKTMTWLSTTRTASGALQHRC